GGRRDVRAWRPPEPRAAHARVPALRGARDGDAADGRSRSRAAAAGGRPSRRVPGVLAGTGARRLLRDVAVPRRAARARAFRRERGRAGQARGADAARARTATATAAASRERPRRDALLRDRLPRGLADAADRRAGR